VGETSAKNQKSPEDLIYLLDNHNYCTSGGCSTVAGGWGRGVSFSAVKLTPFRLVGLVNDSLFVMHKQMMFFLQSY